MTAWLGHGPLGSPGGGYGYGGLVLGPFNVASQLLTSNEPPRATAIYEKVLLYLANLKINLVRTS